MTGVHSVEFLQGININVKVNKLHTSAYLTINQIIIISEKMVPEAHLVFHVILPRSLNIKT